MPENFEKFIFLGAVVALALLSRLAYPGWYQLAKSSGVPANTHASLTASAPLFVMPATGGGTSTTAAPTMLSNESVVVNTPPATTPASSSLAPSTTTADDSTPSTAFTQVGTAPAPAIMDEASLVADLETSTVYLGTNTTTRWPLASVTKLMTASLVIDDLQMDQKVTVPPEAIAVDPTQQLIAAGETFTVSDLLHILLLPSSNVAAETLADFYGRSRFIDQMNARAAAWGMTSTHYDDPSGLSAGNQSTPADLLLLAQRIYTDYPQILAITRTPVVDVTDYTSGNTIVVHSINDFAGQANFIGGKTGYTDQADGNLLSIFRYENRPLLIVIMGTSDTDRFDNTTMLYNWFVQNYK